MGYETASMFDGPGDDVLRHRRKLAEEESTWCDCCQQRIRQVNKHHMDASKVRVLERIAQINVAGHDWAKLQRDGRLVRFEEREWTYQCDDVHGRRLLWFGLVEDAGKRTGLYRVTRDGLRFLRGEHLVPETIYCREGQVVHVSDEHVNVHQVKNVVLDKAYWDAYSSEQVNRWRLE